jgi:rhamnosyltransferase
MEEVLEKVAILMSTYNGQRYLLDQLKSIELQDYGNIELFVRDDGSSDDTISILREFEKSSVIPVTIFQGENVGPAQGFWKLLHNENIKAKYYAYCDQDDIWDPDKVSSAISMLQANQTNVLYFSNFRLIDGSSKILKAQVRTKRPVITLQRLFISGIAQGCAMVMTNVLRDKLCHATITALPMHDLVTMIYGFEMGKVVYDPCPRFSYRSHSGNVVEKRNKTVWERIFTRVRNINNYRRNPMSVVAKEVLKNIENLSNDDKSVLYAVKNYTKSLKYFLRVLTFSWPDAPAEVIRSYRIRVILHAL